MNLSLLREWLSWLNTDQKSTSAANSVPNFEPDKRLCERDYIVLDMLNASPDDSVSFCITDPHQPDNPVIYISGGFCKLTGYDFEDVVGKNCRFLQGEETSREDIKRISDALKEEKECSVNLLNYKKNGEKFVNEVR